PRQRHHHDAVQLLRAADGVGAARVSGDALPEADAELGRGEFAGDQRQGRQPVRAPPLPQGVGGAGAVRRNCLPLPHTAEGGRREGQTVWDNSRATADDQGLKLSAQRALLTHVTRSMRAVSVDVIPEEKRSWIRFIFDGEPPAAEAETASVACTEIMT